MSKKSGVAGLYLLTFFGLLFAVGLADAATPAKPAGHTPAYIAIIIDDLGNHLKYGQRAVALPGPVAYAILPHTRHSRALAKAAHKSGKEILLHLPMQSSKGKEPGPGKLVSGMSSLELAVTVQYNLENVPHAIGINNHMGSGLTQDKQAMGQLMRTIKQYPKMFFVDSVTSPRSVAAKIARQHHISNLSRDIFLDNERSTAAINAQFRKLIRLAKKRGYALAIGHPYPVTLSALEKWLPILDTYKVKLVPLSTLITLRQQEQKP